MRIVPLVACVILPCLAALEAFAQSPKSDKAVDVIDVLVRFTATDGTPLEGKLSLPSGATQPVPVVFYLHGAGPSDYDRAVRYRGKDGQPATTRYYDYYARELGRLGFGFFRMSKRGCSADSAGKLAVDRSVFSKATPTVLVDDYAVALAALRQREEIDARRIVLYGSSEGTRLAPQVAARVPDGIVGLVLTSHQSDNLRDTVVWQNSVGVWRAVVKMIPAASDGSLTKVEYEDALKQNPTIAAKLPFAAVDADKDEVVTEVELTRLVRPRLDAILKAVEDRNDDFLWASLLNLTSAYLLDGWDGQPTSAFLLKLDLPITIFHGELDGTTRVEGVHETAAAFRAAGKSNLTIHVYPGHDHDLNWTPADAQGRGSLPLQESFKSVADMFRVRTENRPAAVSNPR